MKNAVQKLSRDDLATFRDWFLGFDATAWDKQFEEDVAAGRLDALAARAKRVSLKNFLQAITLIPKGPIVKGDEPR